jgi:uncharacterized membrane protein
MHWLERQYSRRLINVNINILMAGVLALMPLALTIHIATVYFGLADKRLIALLTFAADVCFDVVIYYVLHWLANHSPRLLRHKPKHVKKKSFFKDASLVQFERMTLAPILYGFALGLQHLLMRKGHSPTISTVIGFVVGIAVARILHSMWMLRQERRSIAAYQAGLAPPLPAAAPGDDNGAPVGAVGVQPGAGAPARVRSAS